MRQNEVRKVVRRYYEIRIKETDTILEFDNSCHAEQVLRGLVHSGYTVSIQEMHEEKEMTVSEIRKAQEVEGLCLIVLGDRPVYSDDCCEAKIPVNPMYR